MRGNRATGAGSRSSGGCRSEAPPSWRLRVVALLVALGLSGLGSLAVVPAASASPDDGLSETTVTRYEFDGEGPVEVTVTATLVNNKPDSGNYYFFWDSYGVPVPDGADDIEATSQGATLPVSLEQAEDPSYSFAVASFSDLLYGQEREIVWTYTIPGDPIRSESYTRVGPGYATFDVAGSGDTGQVTIEVVTPTSMSFDTTWDGFTASVDGEILTHRSTESQDEYGTSAFISLRDPLQADMSDVTVGETSLQLSSFPGDTEWSDFVTEQVTAGMPMLEDTIGQSWPGGVEVIREDVSPEVFGYAWFDPDLGEIVVSEELDAAVLMHELSHASLNQSTFTERWLYEGLSEFVGQRVAAETSGESSPREAPDREDSDAVALTAWDEVEITDGVNDAEAYAYAASYTAMVALLGDLDAEALAGVISAAIEGESAYAGPDGDDVERQRTDWRRFLDLVETRAEVADADDVYRTWVLDPDQQDLLDARSPARESYGAIDEADGAWLPPLGLRTAMTDWTFEDAATISAELGSEGATLSPDALASTAGAVQVAAEQAGLPVPGGVREQYEEADAASEYAALASLLPQAVEVVGNVGEATEVAADDGNPLGELGQLMLSVDTSAADSRESLAVGNLGAADDAAATTISRAALAPWLGGGVVVVVLAAIAGAALLIIRARRRPVPAVVGGAWGGAPVGFETSGGAWAPPVPGVGGIDVPNTWGGSPMPPPAATWAHQGGQPTTAAPQGWPPNPAASGPAQSPPEGAPWSPGCHAPPDDHHPRPSL